MSLKTTLPPTTQKFTEPEMEALKEIQNQSQQLIFRAGQLYLSKLKIKESEKEIVTIQNNLVESERNIAKELTDKYGKGTIDIESGEFTPIEE